MCVISEKYLSLHFKTYLILLMTGLRYRLLTLILLLPLAGSASNSLPDSLLTVRAAYCYHLISPDTAQAIIQTMRERRMLPDWRLDQMEGDLNYNMRHVKSALEFYERASENKALRDSTYRQMLLTRSLMECNDKLFNDDALMVSIQQMLKLSSSGDYPEFRAMALLMLGKRDHYHGDTEKGYKRCFEAVKLMESSSYKWKQRELSIFYKEILKMYVRDGKYDKALEMSQLQEKAISQFSDGEFMRGRKLRDVRLVYAFRATVLAYMHRMDEATRYYNLWKKLPYGNPIDNVAILDYLMKSGRNQEALDVTKGYRQFITEQSDTLSYRMLTILNREAQIHVALGDYEDAIAHSMTIGVIADSLQMRSSRNLMTSAYDLIKEEEAAERHSLIANMLTVIVVALVILGLVVLYYTRLIRRRNKAMLKVLNGLDAYRDALIDADPVMSPDFVETLEELRAIKSSGGENSEEDEPDDEDRKLFVEMDKQVTRDHLFLNPSLGRDELMRLIGVDKNRFGKMMSKYSDASNVSVYINTKRVEYGAKLLREHPEYTIATIAAECGMSNTVTFNRTFKSVFGVTPSEFRERK